MAEKFDGLFESLAALPEIGPNVAFLFEPGGNRLDIQRFRTEARAQLAR